jgi:hypothetical protein
MFIFHSEIIFREVTRSREKYRVITWAFQCRRPDDVPWADTGFGRQYSSPPTEKNVRGAQYKLPTFLWPYIFNLFLLAVTFSKR